MMVFSVLFMQAQKALIDKGNEYFNQYSFDLAKDYYEKALPSISAKEDLAKVNYQFDGGAPTRRTSSKTSFLNRKYWFPL